MGRKRRSDTHLPRRVYLRHGTYYFVDAAGQWHALGRDLPEALAKYGQKIGGAWSGRTLGDVIDRYRTQVLPLKRSPKTRENEAAALTRLKRFVGHMMPDFVQPPMLYRYIDERRKKDGSSAPEAARHEIALLGHVCAKAIRWGAAVRNPVRGLEKFARKGKRPPVPVSEVEKVKALASERMRLAIDLAVCLGPRRGDLLKLTQANLTDDGIMFRQGKTQREQLIEWSAGLKGIVARCNAMAPQIPNEFLLRKRNGKPYTSAGFNANWQRLIKKHTDAGGQHFTFHDLRSVSADGAATVEEARDRLGHASAETTQRFYRRGVQRGRPRT